MDKETAVILSLRAITLICCLLRSIAISDDLIFQIKILNW